MRKRLIAFFVAVMAVAAQSVACTSVIVGKDASVDGSVMCTYSCDSYGTFHPMYHFPAAKHEKGEMLKIYEQLRACQSLTSTNAFMHIKRGNLQC